MSRDALKNTGRDRLTAMSRVMAAARFRMIPALFSSLTDADGGRTWARVSREEPRWSPYPAGAPLARPGRRLQVSG